jgi:hypothetical protein
MTTHFTEDATLAGGDGGLFQIEFKAVQYLPTDSATAAGALLFGLRPRGVTFACTQDPELFMLKAIAAGYSLEWQANPHKLPAGQEPAPAKILRQWVDAAVALAPDEASAAEARQLIIERLGPHAFEEGVTKK